MTALVEGLLVQHSSSHEISDRRLLMNRGVFSMMRVCVV